MIRIYIYWPKQPDGRGYCPAPVLAQSANTVELHLFPFSQDWQSIEAEDKHGDNISIHTPPGAGLWCFEAKVKGEETDPAVLIGIKWRRLGAREMEAITAGTLGGGGMKRDRVPVEVGQLRRDPDKRRDRIVRVLGVGVEGVYHRSPGVAALVEESGLLDGRRTRIRLDRLEKWEVVPC